MRNILLLRRNALRQVLEGDDSLYLDLCQKSGGDLADFASESNSGEISSQLIEFAHRELSCIESALKNIKDGDYGKCGGCRCSIPVARLEVLPYAKFCISCQRAAESAGVEAQSVIDWSVIIDSNTQPQDLNFKVT